MKTVLKSFRVPEDVSREMSSIKTINWSDVAIRAFESKLHVHKDQTCHVMIRVTQEVADFLKEHGKRHVDKTIRRSKAFRDWKALQSTVTTATETKSG